MIIVLEVVLLGAVVGSIWSWEQRKVQRIHEEGEKSMREAHEIFEDIKHCVEHIHD